MPIPNYPNGPNPKAIVYKAGHYDGKREMAMDQFKEWIKQFDVDKDGRISRDELKEAIRSTRAWFPGWKANRGVKAADANGDGFIDDSEITALMEFAEKNLSIKIMP
ncbi:hypothetical protein RHGRI_021882 [Rhododendron griersonianum]|uniref:EF-hand domain-containing protein n=1 Tax=Rhododendron griersonianum TaxID=479676 RepID=A0AAV6JLR8_9ERIC|nr:hypothetical protein RHGRI_021882 [Rhododendron griersonianum]